MMPEIKDDVVAREDPARGRFSFPLIIIHLQSYQLEQTRRFAD